jgi:hypothetical protein
LKAIMKRLRSVLYSWTGITSYRPRATLDERILCRDVTISLQEETVHLTVYMPKSIPWSRVKTMIAQERQYTLDATNVVDSLGFVSRVSLAILRLGGRVLSVGIIRHL